MYLWDIEFFPPRGQRLSPHDIFSNWPNAAEKANARHKLDYLRENQYADWPKTWYHKVDQKILQLSANDMRIMFCIKDRRIVILHICKKGSKKTHKRDIDRAKRHYKLFQEDTKGSDDGR
jgi:phage-related protein